MDTAQIVLIVATWIPALMIALSGVMKLSGAAQVKDTRCSCYFAGAIATELSHGQLKANPFIPLALVWVGAYLRNPSIFF